MPVHTDKGVMGCSDERDGGVDIVQIAQAGLTSALSSAQLPEATTRFQDLQLNPSFHRGPLPN